MQQSALRRIAVYLISEFYLCFAVSSLTPLISRPAGLLRTGRKRIFLSFFSLQSSWTLFGCSLILLCKTGFYLFSSSLRTQTRKNDPVIFLQGFLHMQPIACPLSFFTALHKPGDVPAEFDKSISFPAYVRQSSDLLLQLYRTGLLAGAYCTESGHKKIPVSGYRNLVIQDRMRQFSASV